MTLIESIACEMFTRAENAACGVDWNDLPETVEPCYINYKAKYRELARLAVEMVHESEADVTPKPACCCVPLHFERKQGVPVVWGADPDASKRLEALDAHISADTRVWGSDRPNELGD